MAFPAAAQGEASRRCLVPLRHSPNPISPPSVQHKPSKVFCCCFCCFFPSLELNFHQSPLLSALLFSLIKLIVLIGAGFDEGQG